MILDIIFLRVVSSLHSGSHTIRVHNASPTWGDPINLRVVEIVVPLGAEVPEGLSHEVIIVLDALARSIGQLVHHV